MHMEYLICLKVFGYIQQIDLYPPGYIIFYILSSYIGLYIQIFSYFTWKIMLLKSKKNLDGEECQAYCPIT